MISKICLVASKPNCRETTIWKVTQSKIADPSGWTTMQAKGITD